MCYKFGAVPRSIPEGSSKLTYWQLTKLMCCKFGAVPRLMSEGVLIADLLATKKVDVMQIRSVPRSMFEWGKVDVLQISDNPH